MVGHDIDHFGVNDVDGFLAECNYVRSKHLGRIFVREGSEPVVISCNGISEWVSGQDVIGFELDFGQTGAVVPGFILSPVELEQGVFKNELVGIHVDLILKTRND